MSRKILLSFLFLLIPTVAVGQVTISPARAISSGGGGGSGDVVGPSGATDSSFACFDGATGKLIKDCLLTSASFLSTSLTSTQNGYFNSLQLKDQTNPSHYLTILDAEDLSANRILSISVNNAARTFSLSGNLTVSSAATISGTNTGDATLSGAQGFLTLSSQVFTMHNIVNADVDSAAAISISKLANISDLRILSNISGSPAAASANTLSAVIDATGCSTQGSVLTRNATTWVCLGPSTSGFVLTSAGAAANLSFAAVTASAPGSTTQMVFNDGGSLGADSGFTYAKATDTATLGYLVANGVSLAYQAKTADYTVLTSDSIIRCAPSSADITLTLPTAVGAQGRFYFFKNIGSAHDCILDGNASETVDGSTTYHVIPSDGAIIYSDNVNWQVQAAAGYGLTVPGSDSVPTFQVSSGTWIWTTVASLGGGGGAPSDAHYWTDRAESGLSAEVNLGALTTGLVKITVSGSVATPSTATSGTDYAPATSGSGILKGNGSGGFSTATAGTDYSSPSSTDTVINKTFNVESTGNVFTTTVLLEWTAGVTQASTASAGCSLPASNPASAVDLSGSNVTMGGVSYDPDTNQHFQCRFWLPSGSSEGGSWTGNVDVEFAWNTTGTSGNACLCVANAAIAAGDSIDPSLSNVNCVNSAAQGIASRLQTATITSITTTGWGDGKMVFLDFLRDAAATDISSITESDTLTAAAKLISVRVIARIAK